MAGLYVPTQDVLRKAFHKKIQGLALGFITVNAAKDSINIDLDSKAKSCHQASNNPH